MSKEPSSRGSLRVLVLPLKRKWFIEIRDGRKEYEYRLANPYWTKRLEGVHYDRVVFMDGYPKRSDAARRIEAPYRGFVKTTIVSEEWNHEPMVVFAILTPNHHMDRTFNITFTKNGKVAEYSVTFLKNGQRICKISDDGAFYKDASGEKIEFMNSTPDSIADDAAEYARINTLKWSCVEISGMQD